MRPQKVMFPTACIFMVGTTDVKTKQCTNMLLNLNERVAVLEPLENRQSSPTQILRGDTVPDKYHKKQMRACCELFVGCSIILLALVLRSAFNVVCACFFGRTPKQPDALGISPAFFLCSLLATALCPAQGRIGFWHQESVHTIKSFVKKLSPIPHVHNRTNVKCLHVSNMKLKV